MPDYMAWADDTAYRMRDFYEANRPLRWWQKRNPPRRETGSGRRLAERRRSRIAQTQ